MSKIINIQNNNIIKLINNIINNEIIHDQINIYNQLINLITKNPVYISYKTLSFDISNIQSYVYSLFEYLVDNEFNIKQVKGIFMECFHKKWYNICRYLIQQNINIYECNNNGYNVVTLSLKYHVDTIEKLEILENMNVDLNDKRICDNNGNTLLSRSCELYDSYDIDIIKYLLEKANSETINMFGPDDFTPLMVLSQSTYIINSFWNINSKCIENKNNAIIRNLLLSKCDVNIGFNNITPLTLLCKKVNINGINVLLKHNLNIQDDSYIPYYSDSSDDRSISYYSDSSDDSSIPDDITGIDIFINYIESDNLFDFSILKYIYDYKNNNSHRNWIDLFYNYGISDKNIEPIFDIIALLEDNISNCDRTFNRSFQNTPNYGPLGLYNIVD